MTNDSNRGQKETFQGQTHLEVKSNHHGFSNPSYLSPDAIIPDISQLKKAERAASPTLSIGSVTSIISNNNLRNGDWTEFSKLATVMLVTTLCNITYVTL